MILAISSSSPWASLALVTEEGGLLAARKSLAPRAASGALLDMLKASLQELDSSMRGLTGVVVDLGPGSFTGTRVGVILGKTLGYALGLKVAGVSSFDLISPDETVAFPSKRGEWFIRRSDRLERVTELPDEVLVGFGLGSEPETFPEASRVTALLDRLAWQDAVTLRPEYEIEPSISVPKTRMGGALP